MNVMRSKVFACAVGLFLMQSYSVCASANNTKKNYNATLQSYDFVLLADANGGNINVLPMQFFSKMGKV